MFTTQALRRADVDITILELVEDEDQRTRLMTFVGAGPAGVEMAGQIAELAHPTLRHEFRCIDPTRARVVLLGFEHRLTTLFHWAVRFVGRGRSERTVTHQQIFARQALDQLEAEFSPSLSPRPEPDSQD